MPSPIVTGLIATAIVEHVVVGAIVGSSMVTAVVPSPIVTELIATAIVAHVMISWVIHSMTAIGTACPAVDSAKTAEQRARLDGRSQRKHSCAKHSCGTERTNFDFHERRLTVADRAARDQR
jgi:phosphate/sulfate permease